MVKIILAAAALMLALLLVVIAIIDPAVGIRSKPASTADNSDAAGRPPSAARAGGAAEPGVGSQEASSLQTASASAHNDKQTDLPALQDDKLSALPAVPGRLNGQTEYYDNWPDRSSIEENENDTIAIRVEGSSRYGKFEIASQSGEQYFQEGGAIRYYGTYAVTYINSSGVRYKLPELGKLAGMALYQAKEKPQSMRVIEMDGFDLVLFEPRNYRFSQGYDHGIHTAYAYAVTAEEEAFPLQFVYNEQAAGVQRTDAIQVNVNGPIKREGTNVSTQATIQEGRYEVTWTPNLAERTLTATDVEDRTAEYAQLADIVSRASKWIEQALGVEEASYPEGLLSEEKLRALFADEAWRNPGFQYLRSDFSKMQQTGNSNRAFAWEPINAEYLPPDRIRFTFTIKLWYAIGLAGYLDASLKKTDGEWKIADLGTLQTETIKGGPEAYSGILIEDPLSGI